MAGQTAEIGTAYISILPSTDKIAPGVRKALGAVEKSSEQAGRSLGSKISAGIGKTLKVGAAATGAAVGGLLAGSIAKGMGRLNSIEQAQAKLEALGNTGDDVSGIMDNALASVKGTAFGIGEAAGTAATMVASGVKPGEKLESVLKGVADSAAIAGVGMDDMGLIWGKVAAKGKLDGETMAQMLERQIPIYDILSEKTGIASTDIADMVSKGKIDFETFAEAMNDYVGGGATRMGETVQGAFQNAGAAMGRFGAALTGPVFSAAPALISAFTTVFDDLTTAVGPAAERIGELLTPALETLAGLVEEKLSPALADGAEKFGELAVKFAEKIVDPALWERVAEIFGNVRDTAERLWPAIESLAGSFMTISQNISAAVWESLAAVLNALAPVIESVLVPLVEKVAEFAEENPGAVQAIVTAFLGFKAVGAVTGPVKTAAGALRNIGGAFTFLSGAFKGGGAAAGLVNIMGGIGSKNPIIAKMAGTVGKLTGAFGKFWTVLSPILKVLGTAIRFINPWVAGFTILAGALTWFFTQTETGQAIVETVTEAIVKAWDWVKEKFGQAIDWIVGKWDDFTGWISGAWDGIKSLFQGDFTGELADAFGISDDNPIVVFFFKVRDAIVKAGEVVTDVFDWIWQSIQVTIAVIGTIVLTPLILAWKALSWAIRTAWESIIKPVWEAIRDAAVALWENHIKPALEAIAQGWQAMSDKLSVIWKAIKTAVFLAWQSAVETLRGHWETITGALSSAWQRVSDFFSSVWQGIKSFVFDAWNSYVNQVKANWDLVTGELRAAWQVVSDRFTAVWKWIRDKVFQPMMDKISELWDSYASPIFQWVGDKWEWLRDAFGAGWDWIRDNVFDAMGRGLDTLKDWFRAGVEGIAKIWDGLKAAAAGPVRFVVDTVWNNGILTAWNSIAEFLPGIDAKDEIPLGDLGRYATGGVLPGYTPGRDVHEFYSPTGGRIHLSGGEAIMRPEWTRAVGGPGAVERMNRDAKTGRLRNSSGHGPSGLWDLGGFAGGGVIGAMMNIVRAKYGNILSMTSGLRSGDGGLHGAGLATDWSNGSGNTPAQLALAHDIAQTYPGSAELIYDSPGWAGNIKNGQNVGPFGQFYTMAQAGPHHHHVHWGMTTPPTMQFGGGVFEGGSNGGGVGGAIVNWIADKARSIWSSIVDPIKDKIGGKAGDWGDSSFAEIPGSMFTSLVDAAWSRLSSLFGSGGGSDSGSVDTSNVPGDVVGAVETVFARHGFTGAEWEAAKWIIQKESGWSPTAQNPSSGAFGLFQFNPMGGNTLGAYLPDRNTDPAVQADAGARYIKDRYGTPSAAKRFWEQNQWYANGGVIPSGMGLFDTGGVWKPGTMGLNLSGKNEYVFTNKSMRDFQRATESLQVVAKEIGAALNGEDWGMGELASYIGADLAASTIEVVQAVGRADRGFREWAAADEERGRMGSPQEWALHYGAQAAATVGNDLLGLVGLGGIIGSTPNESLLDLLQVGAQNLNDVYGWGLPVLSGEELQPVAVIDDEGRVIGSKINPTSDVLTPTASPDESTGQSSASASTPSGAGGAREVVLQIEGDAVSAETLERAMSQLSDELGDVTVRVERLEGQLVASVVSGVAAGIV